MPRLEIAVRGEGADADALRERCRRLGHSVGESGAVELAGDLALLRSAGPALVVGGDRRAALRAVAAGRLADWVARDASDEELAARLERVARAAEEVPEERWQNELGFLLALIRDLATSADLPALLLQTVQHLAGAIGVERCSLVLLDDDGRHASVVASSDLPDLHRLRIALADYPEIREAQRTGEPVVVGDTAHHPLLDPVRLRLERAGVGAVACFPLHLDGRLIGVLMMRARTSFASPQALHLASTAAIATAIAVRHAWLVEEARKTASRQLARYEAFISQISDGVAVLGEGHEVVLLNPAGQAILGLSGDARGTPFFELARPLDPMAAQLFAREIGRGAHVVSAQLEVEVKQGRKAVLAVSAGPLEQGEHGRAILSFRDATEERATERELRRTRDFLERLIEASADAIVAADLKGRILVFNPAAEQMFGRSAAEMRAKGHVRELYPEGGAREVMRLLREAPDGRIEAVRTYARTSQGETIPVELSAALIKVGGREEASVGLLRDLRERVRVENELARTRAQLIDAEKQRAVTALAGATAHELNQPLTVIVGYAELLLRRAPDEALKVPLEAIHAQSERMADIVKRISKLTRVETVPYPGERVIADLEKSTDPPPAQPLVRR